MANGTLAASQLEMLSQSGTGIITIVPPATNTNRAITLPDAAGAIVVSGTTPSLNGITFPATQVASANANTLDDYEEGSWTPAITSIAGFADTSLSVFYAIYIKIGSLVHISATMTFPDSSGVLSVGDYVEISGLPFNYGGTGDGFTSQGPINFSRDPTNGGVGHGYLTNNNRVQARVVAVNGSGARFQTGLYLQFSYRTDS